MKSTETVKIVSSKLAASLWPPRTWNSMLARAEYQCDKLARLVADERNGLVAIRSKGDLAELMRRRAKGEELVGAMLGLEGAHALEGDLDNLEVLHAKGLRMLGLTHFIDNHFAGSAHGMEAGGLSEDGKALIARAQALGIAVDLAHLAPAAVDDVLDLAQKPVVVSHSGVKGTCESPRNLSDDHLRRIAHNGGVVGIAMFEGAVCGTDLGATLDAIDHAVKVAGIDHVGLGADFDGAVTTPVDITGLPLLTQGLLERGYEPAAIKKVMGANVARVLAQTLPD